MRNLLLLTFCVPLLAAGCGLRLGKMTATQRGERLAIERAKFPELTDPVDRTKSYITISHLLLSFASDALLEEDFDDIRALADQYVSTIKSARDAIVESERNRVREPQGYKDLEIALRGQLRVLDDLGLRSPVAERAAVERAAVFAASMHQELMGLLFPEGKPSSQLLRPEDHAAL